MRSPADNQGHASTIAARAISGIFGAHWSRPWVPWLMVGSAVALLACAKTENLDAGFPPCIFRLMTGLPCPTCGLTHAVVAAMHGDLIGSWHYHAFGMPVLAVGLFVFVDQLWWWWHGTPLVRLERPFLRYPLTWVLLIAWIAYAVSRWFMR